MTDEFEYIEWRGFSKGCNLTTDPLNLEPNELSWGENVRLDHLGQVKLIQGITEHSDLAVSGNKNLYYQSLFSTAGIIMRVGTDLYDGKKKIMEDIEDSNMSFQEFSNWLIMVNGTRNLKYKQSGSNLSWNTLVSFKWEMSYVEETNQIVPISILSNDGYACMFEWEKDFLDGNSLSTSIPFYTSTVDLTELGLDQAEVNYPVQLGITPPTSAPALDGSTAGSLTGTYRYYVTYINGDSFESNPSPVSNDIVVSGKRIDLSVLPLSSDPQVKGRKIYRNANGETTYKLLTIINDNSQVTYIDDTIDSDLGTGIETNHNVPPAFSYIHSHFSLLWGVVASEKNIARHCSQYDEWEYFPLTSYEQFGSTSDEIQVLATLGEFLIACRKTGISTFDSSESPEIKKDSFSDRGTISPLLFGDMKDGLVFVDKTGIFFFDTVRDIAVSYPVQSLFDGNFEKKGWRIANIKNAVVSYVNDRVFVSYPGGNDVLNARTMVYDRRYKMFIFLSCGFSAFTVDQINKELYGSSPLDNKIYKILDNDSLLSMGEDVEWSIEKQIGSVGFSTFGSIIVDCNPNGNIIIVEIKKDNEPAVYKKIIIGNERHIEEWELPTGRIHFLKIKISGVGDQTLYGIKIQRRI